MFSFAQSGSLRISRRSMIYELGWFIHLQIITCNAGITRYHRLSEKDVAVIK